MTGSARTVAAGALLVLAALLLGLWVAGEPRAADRWIIAQLGQGWSPVWLALTRLGDAIPRTLIGLAITGWIAWRGWTRGALALVATMAVEALAVSWLKTAFARARPDLLPHLDPVTSLAFPSGHSAHNMAVYLLAGLLARRITGRGWPVAAGVLLALSIGVSRVFLGVHWPSDVLGGWLAGAGFALLGFAGSGTYGRERT